MVLRVTISLIKADVGSLAGHHVVHEDQLKVAKELMEDAKLSGLLIDHFVFNCGDDLELLMTHTKGVNNPEVHSLAWRVFKEVTLRVSKPLKLYAAGQDLLVETFSGNVKGMGPGVAEMEIEERPSEPIVVFAADKTEPGAWNLPLFKIFADAFNTAGLVIDPTLHEGFTFRVLDVIENRYVDLRCPAESYDLLALIGTTGRYVVERVYRTSDGLLAAVSSTTRLSLIAGRYVGKDDPVLIVRAQHGLPAVGEVLAPFATPHLVAGWMRGSHFGPLMPVSLKNAKCTFFDGPPRVVALGFQVSGGKLIGPADLFDDPAFDRARALSIEIATYMRTMGEFMPARLGPEELEYTTLPHVLGRLKDRFKPAD
ncbi:MAG: fructose-1,6-bisphosphate aldolase/phosphatase [Candidatus Nezhaarchaeota archaeon]|nr:fructose-1,6-bisphosphate aldolase/phosphatase [Candidatus Nezhaarchaeota archaeon]